MGKEELRGMPQREKGPDCDWLLTRSYQTASDKVDDGDVVSVNSVAESEGVGDYGSGTDFAEETVFKASIYMHSAVDTVRTHDIAVYIVSGFSIEFIQSVQSYRRLLLPLLSTPVYLSKLQLR